MVNKPITELDFQTIKNQLKEYLRREDGRFKDYDFEGSNLAVLIDILAYNTFQNNFYTNMAISEMFLDSAQLRNSVISHAKELNYLPHSSLSASAVVNLTITSDQDTNFITIPAGTSFSSNTNRYQFITDKAYIATKNINGNFVANNVVIYEGSTVTDTFVARVNQNGYTLSNEKVDINSIRVTVDGDEYTRKNDIFGINEDDRVFYVEPDFNDLYKIAFGANDFGLEPLPNQQISVTYRVCNGSAANSIGTFTYRSGIANTSDVLIATVQRSAGGSEKETIESIKQFAPKALQVQERAVTERDYEILLKQRFPNEIQAISVYGGDQLDPPQYGKVAISIDTIDAEGITQSKINEYSTYLSTKTPLAIQPLFFSAEFMYVDVKVEAFYNLEKTDQSSSAFQTQIADVIIKYNNLNLNQFNGILRKSSLTDYILENVNNLLGINITLNPIIEYRPQLNVNLNEKFRFSTPLVQPYAFNSVESFTNYKPSLISTNFVFNDTNSFLQDTGRGTLNIISSDIATRAIIQRNVGTIDYTSGLVRLANFRISNYDNKIDLIATTEDGNVISPPNRVLTIKRSNINVSATPVRK